MPTSRRENEVDERSSERGDRSERSERRHRSSREKDPNRPHKSRSSRPRPIDPETGEPIRSSHRRRREKDKEKEREVDNESGSMIDIVPELSRTSLGPGGSSRTSLPYPSFSKAHSKEAVNSRENVRLSSQKVNIITPEPTDLGSSDKAKTKSRESLSTRQTKESRPPSPPDTADFTEPRRSTSSRGSKRGEEDDDRGSRPGSRSSRRSNSLRDDKSKLSTRSKGSRASTAVKMSSGSRVSLRRSSGSTVKEEKDSDVEEEFRVEPIVEVVSAVDSNATSVTPRRRSSGSRRGQRPPNIDTDSSPASAQDSSPQTPTQTGQFTPVVDVKPAPSPFVSFDVNDQEPQPFNSPQPPPPPPPFVPINIPRIDYLMQNGGLHRPIPRKLLAATNPYLPNHYQSRIAIPPAAAIEKVFGPYHSLLDNYETVLSKSGSLAVATGYRSVARRLLERLEAVFARDLPSEGCLCVMCQRHQDDEDPHDQPMGWGDVLEWVSGRRELPEWPAFDFGSLGLSGDDLADGFPSKAANPPRPSSPVKLDPDIADEFREHYLRQSKKTRAAVDRWLTSCPEAAAAPPQEVDDETLSFAILTHLDREDRPIYNALIAGSSQPIESMSRAPTPGTKPRADFIVKTAQSIQRLYRLPATPRDPEAAIYLLKNPEIHKLLATLTEINNSEWEILISGRFDGFLWSGADADFPSRTATPFSRGPTPANGLPVRQPSVAGQGPPGFPSRGPTPSSFAGGPSARSTPFQARASISNDEEAEVAVLAEVEREIYLGMEALEDAFEALHRKAEVVRRALRERGAGLTIAAQSRMAAQPGIVRLDTPGLGISERGNGWGHESDAGGYSESDWAGDDAQSELAPDDSASNISSSRHRRPKRRNERRTPAPVEEEDEEE